MRLPRAIAAAALVAIACGPVDGAPPGKAPVNACPDHPCDRYQPYDPGTAPATCTKPGICAANHGFDWVLVVSLPLDSFFAPSTTFAIPSKDLFARPDGLCSQAGSSATNFVPCARLPQLSSATGEYVVFPHVEISEVGYYLGNQPGQTTILPSHATYRPLWPPGDKTAGDAVLSGLPLEAVQGTNTFAISDNPGPAGGPPIAFQIAVPTSGDTLPLLYERTVMPDPPFDSAYPPDVQIVAAPEGNLGNTALQLTGTDVVMDRLLSSSQGLPTFNLSRADGAPMDGAIAYLRDETTKRRISAKKTLGRAPDAKPPFVYRVLLAMSRHPPAGKDSFIDAELVVEPPPTEPAAPTWIVQELADQIPEDEVIPTVAGTSLVSGTITAQDDDSAVPAEIVLTSTKIDLADPNVGFTRNLVYTTRVSTDDAGRYAATLPRGEYDVVVLPRDAGHAMSVGKKLVLDPTNAEQAGKNFQLARKKVVRGAALVSDGRPLAAADVFAVPAASLAGAVAPEQWPRAATARTEDQGGFTLELDPGTYDLTVQPAPGTGFPWFVSTSRVVGATDVSLEPFDVPPPVVVDMVLNDPHDNPIARAVVRAYARPPTMPAGAEAPYVPIGAAMTDANGRFTLDLAGAPR